MKRSQFLILVALLLIIIIISLYCCWWRKSGEDKSGDKKPGAVTTLTSPLTGTLHRLVLKKSQYETIKGAGADKAKKLVFVFYFDDAFSNYPTLAAFASKNNHFTWYKDSVMLAPTGNGYLPLPDVKFLGNQEIQINAIDDYLEEIFGHNNPQPYNHLLFTPEVDATTKFIRYKISVVCIPNPCPTPLAEPATNPSPPKNGE